MTMLLISNQEMEDTWKIVKPLKESTFLMKVVCEIIENGAKEQKGGFLSMLLCTLGASFNKSC